MDYIEKFKNLQLQKIHIEAEMEQVVIDWVHSHNLKDRDKFVFISGINKDKHGQIVKGRNYRLLKKDGTPNNTFGLQSFWLYDMQYADIEKL